MVREYLHGYLSILQIWPPRLKAIDDSQQFLVIDLIVAFGADHFLAIESHRVKRFIVAHLGQYTSSNVVRGIRL